MLRADGVLLPIAVESSWPLIFATIEDASSGLTLGLVPDGPITVMEQHSSSRGLALDAHTLYFSFWDNRPGSVDSPTLAAWSRDSHTTVTADLTPTNNTIGNVALGGDHLYFGGWTLPTSGMWSVSLPFAAGAKPQQVSTGAASPYRVAVDAQNIYYDEGALDGENGPLQTRVSKVARGGGTPTLIDSDTNVDDMIVADGSLFWADRVGGVVRSYDGLTARDYAEITEPIALAADPAHHQLYVLSNDSSSGTSSIVRIPSNHAGATPQTCVTGMGISYAIYFYGGELYFGSWADAKSPSILFDLTTIP